MHSPLRSYGVVTYTNPNGAFLVCYNCHSYNKYGSIFLATGVDRRPRRRIRCRQVAATASATPCRSTATPLVRQPTAPSSSAASKVRLPIWCNSCICTGLPAQRHRTCSASRILTSATSSASSATTATTPALATLTAVSTAPLITTQLQHCNTVNRCTVTGGAYIDGMGNTTKVERFLPGLGNAMHVPGTLGGFTGGTVVPFDNSNRSCIYLHHRRCLQRHQLGAETLAADCQHGY